VQEVIDVLSRNGAIAVIPTDTVYGVVARASDKQAVSRLYELKQRHHKPGTLIAASIDQLVTLGIPRRYLKAVEQYWPGAVSVVIPCGPALEYLAQGQHSLAIRIPSKPDLLQLLEQTGPLLTSSANRPGEPTATNVAGARAYFGDRVDYYQDGGNLEGQAPSTVIRIIDDAVEVLRAGAVTINPETGAVVT
jgi:tRNA threonylcarbamoyl adenosine modification protein (Sua5/YciO/YrdC/YwlC family)